MKEGSNRPVGEYHIYFTSHRHLYVMLVNRVDAQITSPAGLAPFATSLLMLPFDGKTWSNVALDLLKSSALLIQIPFRY
jgi:hypothetical protein